MNSKERGERSENQEPTTKNTPVADREQPYSAWVDLMVQRNYNGKSGTSGAYSWDRFLEFEQRFSSEKWRFQRFEEGSFKESGNRGIK